MPCNLALSIAKATVADEHLWTLLEPRLQSLVSGFLRQEYAGPSMTARQVEDVYQFTLGALWITIERGQVQVLPEDDSTEEQELAETLGSQLSLLLEEAASRLFQDEVEQALGQLGAVVRRDQPIQDEGGEIRQAAVFTVTTIRQF